MADNVVGGRCYVCISSETIDRPPVAVCHRCGAIVCKEHSVRLVHHPRRIPPGRLSSSLKKRGRYREIVCEDCNLTDLEVLEARLCEGKR
jgi:hypothetical protein